MAKSKAAKRKRAAQADLPQKLPKAASTLITPPPDGKTVESTHLNAVVSDEDLDITIETLTALAEYPGLTKSKACKDLRVAVYDFRQTCTTGVNTAEGANLTARITGALTDGKYMEAKILLAEMRIRGEQPKIGALCRWVRDLDVVSGLSTRPKSQDQVLPKPSAKDLEIFGVLDAILRVSTPIDINPNAIDATTPIAFQAIWDLRPPTTPLPVYASVLDKSILALAPKDPSALRVIEETPGPLRKPPNHHPAILYTTVPNAVPLAPVGPTITYHPHPAVPGLGLALNVLSASECKAIIAAGESVNFVPDAPLREDGDVSILAHNFYWIIDTTFHDMLWARISPYVPPSINGRLVRGINRRFRVYRYVPGAEYRCHIDGAWPPSGILPDDTYVYDSSPEEKMQSSMYTFLLYLNDEFEGGETTFFVPAVREGTLNGYPVQPVMGAVAIFPHGESNGALLHEGTGVRKGAKYIIRTDVEYDVNPSEDG
ncbi:Prolyl 4-hydroxylase alpha subunit [Penicillium bovifimosum]|uniref:Prolyl 4-hydroxylase alpha subunit n=1 Tax=Penicillium bovifimosum TaxID=126998 RepID=A0A9W9KWK5_9EURO|nr:Prolyl 4-hydroxylase alpha subunit [Penicillium bovifimosum]KAJ5123805.1 Prolyl 4-hydroxylase alpha subunit [Penicillium bovifimosum]